MIADLKDYVSFLCKHKMTGDQFLFCCLIYERDIAGLYKIVQERGQFDKNEIRDLEDRGYVINSNTGDEAFHDGYEITEKFIEEIYGQKSSMWEEILELYPQFIFFDNKRIPAQSADLDALRIIYSSKIQRNVKKHKEIMELLKYAVDNDLISMGIDKWIRGEQWKAIKAIKTDKPKEKKYGEREI